MHNAFDRLAAENERLREVNAELLEAVKEAANELGCNDPQDLAFESEMCGRFRAVIDKATADDLSTSG